MLKPTGHVVLATPVCPLCLQHIAMPDGARDAFRVVGDPTVPVKVLCVRCDWEGRVAFYEKRDS